MDLIINNNLTEEAHLAEKNSSLICIIEIAVILTRFPPSAAPQLTKLTRKNKKRGLTVS